MFWSYLDECFLYSGFVNVRGTVNVESSSTETTHSQSDQSDKQCGPNQSVTTTTTRVLVHIRLFSLFRRFFCSSGAFSLSFPGIVFHLVSTLFFFRASACVFLFCVCVCASAFSFFFVCVVNFFLCARRFSVSFVVAFFFWSVGLFCLFLCVSRLFLFFLYVGRLFFTFSVCWPSFSFSVCRRYYTFFVCLHFLWASFFFLMLVSFSLLRVRVFSPLRVRVFCPAFSFLCVPARFFLFCVCRRVFFFFVCAGVFFLCVCVCHDRSFTRQIELLWQLSGM